MKMYKNSLRDIDDNELIYAIPRYEVKEVYTPNSERMDWGLKMFGVPNFWKFTKGKGVKVAVLDTGYDTSHNDLIDNVVRSKNFTKSPACVHDVVGHGTHCAGIIAAKDNNSGVVGVAPEVELYIAKVLDDSGSGNIEDIVDGINWAVKHKVDIISMSFGSPYPSLKIHKAIKKAINRGIIVICAAGNEGSRLNAVGYPAAFDEVIAVGAINQNKRLPYYTSRGKSLDIVAPGDDILSCYPPNGLAKLSGTSMAAPFVAGIVALIIAKHRKYSGETPAKNQEEMEEHLRRTATDYGPNGFDIGYGYGLIDPEELLRKP